ncbi:HEAT repeat domain-containing protein [Candidatus Ozemobacteraceae bacterium]|nr:HEAT repeat domain-containing protein [Candidatus Ozemobacteraceae bacterium]
MSPEIVSGQCPYPDSLEVEDWLDHILAGEDEQAAIVALAYAKDEDLSPRIQERLESIASGRFSACRDLAADLILIWHFRNADILRNTDDVAPTPLRDMLSGFPPAMRRAMQKTTWRLSSEGLLQVWRDHLLNESDPIVLSIGLSLLANHGSAEDANQAAAHLGSEHPCVVNAALDLLAAQNPSLLKTLLLGALLRSEPEIRFHAIRILRNIDPSEGVAFIESAMADEDPVIRLLAARALMVMPFEIAEAAYLQFLGLETQPFPLVLLGRELVRQNAPDLPLRLFDTLMMSKGVKRHILQLILDGAIEHIKTSGSLTIPVEEYVQRLQSQLRERHTDLVIALGLRDLRNTDPELRLGAIERLSGHVQLKRVADAFRARLKSETEEPVKQALTHALESIAEPAATPQAPPRATPGEAPHTTEPIALPATPPEIEAFLQTPPDDQAALMGLIRTVDGFKTYRTFLGRLLPRSQHRLVTVRLLSLYERFGTQEDAPSLRSYLRNPDPGIVGQALKAMGRLDADQVLPLLNPLLRSDSLQIKTAAIEVLLTLDKEGAFQHLRNLLESPVRANKRKGLELVPHVDYAIAEPVILKMLEKETVPDLISRIGLIILSNPNPQGLKSVYQVTHRDQAEQQPELVELWEMARECAAQILGIEAGSVDEYYVELFRKDQEKAAEPEPAYAFSKASQKMPRFAKTLAARSSSAEPGNLWETSKAALFSPWGLAATAALCLYLAADILPRPSGPGTNRTQKQDPLLPSTRQMEVSRGPGGTNVRPLPVSGRAEAAGDILGGPRYETIISDASREREAFRTKIKRDAERHTQEWYERLAKDPATRATGLFYLNKSCRTAKEALDKGNYGQARDEFRKAIADPDLPEDAKMLAYFGFISACMQIGDKDGIADAWDKLNELSKKRGINLATQMDGAALKRNLELFSKQMDDPSFLSGLEKDLRNKAGQNSGFSPARQAQCVAGMKEFARRLGK